MNLGDAIRSIRKSNNISQKDLAKMSGISIQSMWMIESGKQFPYKETLINIAVALGVSVPELLLYALDDEDISEEKREVFKVLRLAMMSVLSTDKK